MKTYAVLGAAVTATLLGMSGCVTGPDPLPFDAAKFQQNTRQAGSYLPNQTMKPLPTTMDTRYSPRMPGQPTSRPFFDEPSNGRPLDADPILRMSLQEAIHRAVNNNMEIRVAGYDPAIDSNRVIEAEAKFDPTFFVNPFYQWSDPAYNSNSNTFTPDSPLSIQPPTQTYGVSTGIRQDLQQGGSAEIRIEPTQYWNKQSSGNPNFWVNALVADLKQPLLKNFGAEVNTARIVIARNDQRISLLEYRKKVEEVLFTLEQTYWQLREAEDEVRISETLLQRTIDTAEILAKRSALDVTGIQTSQATSAIELRRATLIESRAKVREFSDRLKQLMNDPELPVASSTLVLTGTDPVTSRLKFDWQDQINQALEHRFDLAQQILKVDSQSVITRVAKNNLLPTLNLVQTITSQGASTLLGPAADSSLSFENMIYRVGVQFEVPIGNRQAEAIYQRTLLQRQQTIDQYRSILDQTSLEVKAALRNMQTAWEQMASNRQAVLSTAETLDKITARMDKADQGYDPSFVQLRLDTQARLADAQRQEAIAISGYNVAVVQLERAKGTLLRYDNVLMEEDQLRVVARSKLMADIPQLSTAATQPSRQNP